MPWISTFTITKIYTDGSLDTFQWIRFVNFLGFRPRWNKKSCKVHVHLLDSSGLRSSPTVILMSLPVLRFFILIYFLVSHVCLCVTMTSTTQGKITGMINTEYYMSKSVSPAVSTREPYITPRATGPRGDIGWGLIRHVIQILTCNVHYSYFAVFSFDLAICEFSISL